MSIDGTVGVTFNVNDRRTVGISTSGNLPINIATSITFADGVGAAQANVDYSATLTLVAGVLNVDLSGILHDLYGDVITPARLKGIYLKNTGTAAMTFGAASSNTWAGVLNSAGTITLNSGAFMLIADPTATGMLVTAGTGDILKVSGTGTDTFDIALLGGKT